MANKKLDNGKLNSDHEKWLAERKIGVVLWTFFDTKNPARENAWTDLYCEYLERIKDEHHEFFKEIVDLQKKIVGEKKLRAVFLLFKKIVPTIAPSDRSPLDFLQDSLLDVKKHKDYNKLCVFVQIATQKLKELEDRVMDNGTHNKLLLPRKKYEERSILYPLFETIQKNGIGFSKGYKEIIVPTLIEHEKYLLRTIGKCIENMEKESVFRKNKKASRKHKSVLIKQKLEEYKKIRYRIIYLYVDLKEHQEYHKVFASGQTISEASSGVLAPRENKTENVELTKNELIKNIFKIDTLKTNYIRNRFYEWKNAVLKEVEENPVNCLNKTDSSIGNDIEKEPYVIVSSSKLMLPTSYVKSVFWSPIFNWPINNYLMEISAQERKETAMERSVVDEIWTIIPK